MALSTPDSSFVGDLARNQVNRRRDSRLPPTAELPVRVEIAAQEGAWSLGRRAAWDVSREGVAVGLLDDEASLIRLNAAVRVRLETAEGSWELVGQVAHLNRVGLSPVWPCILGVQLDLAGYEPVRDALCAYVERLQDARGRAQRG